MTSIINKRGKTSNGKANKNKKQYEDALVRVYALMQKDVKPDSKDSDELEVLSIHVKEYENKRYPVSGLKPLEAINPPNVPTER